MKIPVFKLTKDQKDVDNDPDDADDFKNAQYDSKHYKTENGHNQKINVPLTDWIRQKCSRESFNT